MKDHEPEKSFKEQLEEALREPVADAKKKKDKKHKKDKKDKKKKATMVYLEPDTQARLLTEAAKKQASLEQLDRESKFLAERKKAQKTAVAKEKTVGDAVDSSAKVIADTFTRIKNTGGDASFPEAESAIIPAEALKEQARAPSSAEKPATPKTIGRVLDLAISKVKNTQKTVKETASKGVDVITLKSNIATKSTEELRKIAQELLAQKNTEQAFEYFDAINQGNEQLAFEYPPENTTDYLVHIITKKGYPWLKQYIGEETFFKLAVTLLAKSNQLDNDNVKLLREKCMEMSKNNPQILSKILQSSKTDPKQLKNAFLNNDWINLHIANHQKNLANKIIDFIDPLIRDNPEMLEESIKDAIKSLKLQYHADYFKDITPIVIQQQSERAEKKANNAAIQKKMEQERRTLLQKDKDQENLEKEEKQSAQQTTEREAVQKQQQESLKATQAPQEAEQHPEPEIQPAKKEDLSAKRERQRLERQERLKSYDAQLLANEKNIAEQQALIQNPKPVISLKQQKASQLLATAIENRDERENRNASAALQILQKSISLEQESLTDQKNIASGLTNIEFQKIQTVLNNNMPPNKKLTAAKTAIIEADQYLSKQIGYSKFSKWHAFGKIAVATLTGIGIPIAIGMAYTQYKYGSHHFWSDAALDAGRTKKSLKKLSKEINLAQKESHKPKKLRP